ncbi:MAG: hypothetical protein ACREC0_03140 [Methylocella sp.]
MTMQLRDVLLQSAQMLLRDRGHYDRATEGLIDNIFLGLDGGYGTLPIVGSPSYADRRAARTAFANFALPAPRSRSTKSVCSTAATQGFLTWRKARDRLVGSWCHRSFSRSLSIA